MTWLTIRENKKHIIQYCFYYTLLDIILLYHIQTSTYHVCRHTRRWLREKLAAKRTQNRETNFNHQSLEKVKTLTSINGCLQYNLTLHLTVLGEIVRCSSPFSLKFWNNEQISFRIRLRVRFQYYFSVRFPEFTCFIRRSGISSPGRRESGQRMRNY